MSLKIEKIELPTAELNGVNPLPAFRRRKYNSLKHDDSFPSELRVGGGYMTKPLPYLLQDRYTSERKVREIDAITLENEYLKAVFLPSYGGRLHSLFDKVRGRELLFTNTVIQPRNLATRNAWLSGGIEWNVGNFGHTYTTCDNVFAAVLEADGEKFLRIYEFERNKSIFWQIDFHLPCGSRLLYSHVKQINPFDKDTTTYWWTNIAVPTDTQTRILASNKNVISFVGASCHFDTLPNIEAFPGRDVTFPENADRAFDYFIQKDEDGESTWEAAAYNDGTVFFERSTAPLYYKKLFAWGNHRAGKHWQEFLSDGEGTGYYAEMQAGIAPSQLHDKLFPKRSVFEWTQCFGGASMNTEILFGDYNNAVSYCGECIASIIDPSELSLRDEKFKEYAMMEVKEDNIVHLGAGFGALETKRMKKMGDGTPPESQLYPETTIGENEKIWDYLLANGEFPNAPVTAIPSSYMISEKWLPLLREAAKRDDALAKLHLGVAIYEYQRTDVLLCESYNKKNDIRQIKEAISVWLRSVELMPNAWTYRNLAVAEEALGNNRRAEKYYDRAMSCPEALSDYAIASEYMKFLLKPGKHKKLWEVYLSLPENFKKIDRIDITASIAAVKLDNFDFLEGFFAREHHDIREGELALTDVWFEYSAKLLAKERGIKNPRGKKLSELIDEAWVCCPPAKDIDFRMSTKKTKYRVG